MNIKISKNKKGLIGICGHVGVGHTHSHSGFVQDDSAGFAVTATILKKALTINSIIASVDIDINQSTITVNTKDGGSGQVWVRRGITPSESQMMKKIIGMDSIYSQDIVIQIFGRIYGQGVMEVPVSLQGAIVLSLIDTFKKKWPHYVNIVNEDISFNIGKILGTVIEIDGISISILLTINSSLGGIGPIEDLEGNIPLGKKGQLIKKIGLNKIPTIIIESKSYLPQKGNYLNDNTFFIRANNQYDNLTVAKNLIKAARDLDIIHEYSFDDLNRNSDDFTNASKSLGEKIVQMGQSFKIAETSKEKVEIISNLATLVSQDAGGVTFMSNDLQRDVGGAGMVKGTSAVISLLVTRKYIDQFKVPFIKETDINKYISIIYNGILNLYAELNIALLELEKKYAFEEESYNHLFEDTNDNHIK